MGSDERQQELFGDSTSQSDTCSADKETVQPEAVPAKPAGSVNTQSSAEVHEIPLSESEIYVIDSFALIYQLFFALPPMSGPSGQPVGAVHGYARDLIELIESKNPTHVIAVFDPPGEVFRHEFYPEYKANRDPMPDDLRNQIPNIKRILKAMGIAMLEVPNFEADDVMATVAHQIAQAGGNAYLVTSDKDCRQLLSDNVKMYNIRKDTLFEASDLMDAWGIRPEQVVDFQSLVGDSVDNVPGVQQIGPKTATALLAEFGDLEGVLENAHTVKAKNRRENLMNGRDDAMLSRRLVELDRHVDVEIDWRAAQIGGMDYESVEQLCDEFGFRRLKDRLLNADVETAPAVWECEYVLVESLEQLQDLLSQISRDHLLSIDTETTSVRASETELVGYSFAWEEGKAYYVPVKSREQDLQLDADAVRDAMKVVLEDPQIKKVGQNLKFDMVVLRNHGIRMQGLYFDTLVAHYLLQPGVRNHKLETLSQRYLNHKAGSFEELCGKGKKQITIDQAPLELVTHYAAEDADVVLRLVGKFESQIDEQELTSLLHDLELPLIEVLVEMESNGIRVDTELLHSMSERFAVRLETLRSDIHQVAGGEFNIDSPKQLSKVLFEDLGLPVIKKTKTGASTDAEVLKQLSAMDVGELPGLVMEYRQIAKLKSTYVDALPKLVNPETSRVHSAFNQDVAATGRLSSADPNLQNIPIRSEEGRQIRAAFVPPEDGWNLLAADYSQVELRVLAHFSGDETLQQAFIDDQDIHKKVAAEVYDVSLDEVTSEMRSNAKAVNFGVIYGQSAFGLAKSLGISKGEAADFIDAYFEQYPGVERFMLDTLAQAHREKSVSTIRGRRRPVSDVRNPDTLKDKRQRNLSERIAINTVIQGSAADIIKIAMLEVLNRLETEAFRSRLLLQIHDELVFEVPDEELEQLEQMVREEMAGAADLSVPLKVDINVGKNWAECK
jgi:DNA polymerase-1